MIELAAALLLAASTEAAAIPARITAEYEVTNLGVTIGRVHETFVREGGRYSIQSVTRAAGPLKLFLDEQVTLESKGTVGEAGLRPEHFEQRRLRKPERNVSADFDWARGVIRANVRGERREFALPQHTQDRLSLMYQLMRARPAAGPMTVPMSNGRKVELYTYRYVGEERIETPAGAFDTLRFERVSGPKENKVEVWLARERFNFPVRIVFEDDDGPRLVQSLLALQVR